MQDTSTPIQQYVGRLSEHDPNMNHHEQNGTRDSCYNIPMNRFVMQIVEFELLLHLLRITSQKSQRQSSIMLSRLFMSSTPSFLCDLRKSSTTHFLQCRIAMDTFQSQYSQALPPRRMFLGLAFLRPWRSLPTSQPMVSSTSDWIAPSKRIGIKSLLQFSCHTLNSPDSSTSFPPRRLTSANTQSHVQKF